MGLTHDIRTNYYDIDSTIRDEIERKAKTKHIKYLKDNNYLTYDDFVKKNELAELDLENNFELYAEYLRTNNIRDEDSFVRELSSPYLGGIYSFSTGFSFEKGGKYYGTIMSYDQNLPYFSNPSIKCSTNDLSESGLKCGSEFDNSSRSLNLTAKKISNFCSASKRDRSDLATNFELVKLIAESEAETIDFDFTHPYYNEFNTKDQFGIYQWNKTGLLNFDTANKQVVDDEGNSSIEETTVLMVQDSKYFPAVGFELSCVAEEKKAYIVGASVKTAKPGKSTLWLYYELAALDPKSDTQVKKWIKLDEKDTDNNQFTDLEAAVRLPENITVARIAITSTNDNTLVIDKLVVVKEK
ncbi:hypothetical protein [Spartinivicinus poritis]|uniref:Uncharacterized protein n=1 Tax=Spartinivicinus poritis TaxID=2994640 RepID=A0ABT5UI58_9GAMM|nr:hypothetical protein [Spartinivicinus sp. A2-2]MDE1466074.1 hypothetical protein [Spartinivicinus sp. A2-2]